MTKEYDDIIHLPRHVSTRHPHMDVRDRAAQFSPFAALTGHDAAIKETARLTDKRVELTEYTKEMLRERLQFIVTKVNEYPEIFITYFSPDEKKIGGSYITVKGRVKKIDEYVRVIILEDGLTIPIDEVIDIEGQVFETIRD